jgi:hypothetical protein
MNEVFVVLVVVVLLLLLLLLPHKGPLRAKEVEAMRFC